MFSSSVAALLIGLSVSDLSMIFQSCGIASILVMSANGKVLPVGPNISDTLIISLSNHFFHQIDFLLIVINRLFHNISL